MGTFRQQTWFLSFFLSYSVKKGKCLLPDVRQSFSSCGNLQSSQEKKKEGFCLSEFIKKRTDYWIASGRHEELQLFVLQNKMTGGQEVQRRPSAQGAPAVRPARGSSQRNAKRKNEPDGKMTTEQRVKTPHPSQPLNK